MPFPRHVADGDARHVLDQADDLRLAAVDHADLAALQRAGARGGVVDHHDLDLVRVSALVRTPITLMQFADMTHTGFVDGHLVRSGADARGRIVLAAVRLDHQVIVADDIGKIGIRLLQGDDEVAAIRLDAFELLHEGKSRGF
jgi:hypothetical protein